MNCQVWFLDSKAIASFFDMFFLSGYLWLLLLYIMLIICFQAFVFAWNSDHPVFKVYYRLKCISDTTLQLLFWVLFHTSLVLSDLSVAAYSNWLAALHLLPFRVFSTHFYAYQNQWCWKLHPTSKARSTSSTKNYKEQILENESGFISLVIDGQLINSQTWSFKKHLSLISLFLLMCENRVLFFYRAFSNEFSAYQREEQTFSTKFTELTDFSTFEALSQNLRTYSDN